MIFDYNEKTKIISYIFDESINPKKSFKIGAKDLEFSKCNIEYVKYEYLIISYEIFALNLNLKKSEIINLDK